MGLGGLNAIEGKKVVYFITDGRPTAPDNETAAIKKAKAEAEKLKSVSDLEFNAFFLQNAQSGVAVDTVGFATLKDIVGDEKRVVRTDSAAELAVAVGNVAQLKFALNDISATITPSLPENAKITIKSIAADPAAEGVWKFDAGLINFGPLADSSSYTGDGKVSLQTSLSWL